MTTITRAILVSSIAFVNNEVSTAKEILEVYNRFASAPVKRFADRKTAVRRTLALLETLLVDYPEEVEAVEEKKSLSASIAKSWNDPVVAEKRLTRNGVIAYVGDEAIEFKSLRVAFAALRLPDSKHIAFRQILKAEKEATFTFGKTSIKFALV